MIQIVTDTSSLITPDQAAALGIYSLPFEVVCNGKSQKECTEISREEVLSLCKSREKLSTSQPSAGAVLDLYDEILADPDNVILDVCLSDGLSGAYAARNMARNMCSDPSRVHIFNSTTLCGPQKHMVLQLIGMKESGSSLEEMKQALEFMASHTTSCLAVADFSWLAQGGRLPGAAAKAGAMLKVIPYVHLNEEGTALSFSGICRTMKKACKNMAEFLSHNEPLSGEGWKITVAHAGDEKKAAEAAAAIEQMYPAAQVEVEHLSAVFMIHGGPGCISVQAIQMAHPEKDAASKLQAVKTV